MEVSWGDPDVTKTLREAIRGQSSKVNNQECLKNRNKSQNYAPSARLTPAERDHIPKIRLELARDGITAERWELRALVRGGKVSYNGKLYSCPLLAEWYGFGHKLT